MNYNHETDWYYEGNISRALVQYFSEKGFTIIKHNSDNIKERGVDIIIEDSTSFIIMEVKGYPTSFHTKGPNKGKPKVTKPKLQAKHLFNEVIMSAILNYSKYRAKSNLKLAIGIPKFEIYEKLVKNIEEYFSANELEFQVYFVDEYYNVEELNLNKNKKTSP
jgi:hypothetical protein